MRRRTVHFSSDITCSEEVATHRAAATVVGVREFGAGSAADRKREADKVTRTASSNAMEQRSRR
jgi:hypothetical protein